MSTFLGNLAGSVITGLLGSKMQQGQGGSSPTPVPSAQGGISQGISSGAEGLITQGMDYIGQRLFAQKQGKLRGETDRAYMDEFAPGTTPWERIGAASPGAAQVASADKQSRTALSVARIQQQTSENVARIQAEPAHRQAMQQELKTLSEIDNLDTDTQVKMGEALFSGAKGTRANEYLDAEIRLKELGNVYTTAERLWEKAQEDPVTVAIGLGVGAIGMGRTQALRAVANTIIKPGTKAYQVLRGKINRAVAEQSSRVKRFKEGEKWRMQGRGKNRAPRLPKPDKRGFKY